MALFCYNHSDVQLAVGFVVFFENIASLICLVLLRQIDRELEGSICAFSGPLCGGLSGRQTVLVTIKRFVTPYVCASWRRSSCAVVNVKMELAAAQNALLYSNSILLVCVLSNSYALSVCAFIYSLNAVLICKPGTNCLSALSQGDRRSPVSRLCFDVANSDMWIRLRKSHTITTTLSLEP